MVKNISPCIAWKMLIDIKNSYLIDVRTNSELLNGKPNLDSIGKKLIMLEWKKLMDMSVNSFFLEKISEIIVNDDVLIFLCRSGIRSHEASKFMFAKGYKNCYNVEHGFCDGTVFSWQCLNLPWS